MSSLYFDNAATSFPKPKKVYDAVKSALILCPGNPGRGAHKASALSAKAIYETREAIAAFCNTNDPTKVIFGNNATAVLNTAILGIKLDEGGFLISNIEHNAVLRPVAERCRRENRKFNVFETSPDDDNLTLRSFVKQLDNKPSCVVINAASNVDGRILPIYEIGRICMERSIHLIIDASQLLGHRSVDMQKLHCSILCSAGHKALYSPMSSGFGIFGDMGAVINPIAFGGNGVNSKELFIGNAPPESFEVGTLPVHSIIGIKAGIDYHRSELGKKAALQLESTISYLLSLLNQIDKIKIYHAKNGVPVISITHENMESESLAAALSQKAICVRAGFHCAPLAHRALGTYENGTVRISPSQFNSRADCKYLADEIGKL